MKNNLFPKGIPQTHFLIIDLIQDLFPEKIDRSNISVLDAAAGNGFITDWLNDNSFNVTPIDIDTSQWAVENVACIEHNLNYDFPLEENKFDLIVSVETIEHIENPYHFIRECQRVLKPGGTMIISTPNVHAFRSRLKYLFLGLPSLFEYVNDDLMGQHITPVSIGTFFYAFDRLGIEMQDVYSTGLKKNLILGIIEPIINLFSSWIAKLIGVKKKFPKDHFLRRLNNQQLRQLYNETVLIVTAKSTCHYSGTRMVNCKNYEWLDEKSKAKNQVL